MTARAAKDASKTVRNRGLDTAESTRESIVSIATGRFGSIDAMAVRRRPVTACVSPVGRITIQAAPGGSCVNGVCASGSSIVNQIHQEVAAGKLYSFSVGILSSRGTPLLPTGL